LSLLPKFAAALKEKLPIVVNIKISVPLAFGNLFINFLTTGKVLPQAIGKPIPIMFDKFMLL